ncbi:phosphoglycolate phosphatase [Shumkonia mesophila]|uniref:phosphoglycolate phosphatase n=1 Tax=Shumkonia mesophila TaxID=2838854 RepID=UPI0029341D8F|nr:phosphoglycolate phosphatase [Shumkonia mesophila]
MNHLPGPGPQAIVFDLDGTLIDSAPDLQAAINRTLAADGRPPLSVEAVKAMVGDGVPKLVERAFAATGGLPGGGADALAAWVARFGEDYENCGFPLTRPFAGTLPVLAALGDAGFKLALCTNKPQAATVEILDRLDLARFFDAVVGGDAVPGVRKPHPGHLLAALAALGVEPARAAMVGDHLNDLSCARGAGMPVVLCAYGYSRTPVGEMGADAVIERIEDLPAALAALAPARRP